jgi:hypothetical protein
MKSGAQCANKIPGAFSMFRIATFDPVSFTVMGFGVVLAAALPFFF